MGLKKLIIPATCFLLMTLSVAGLSGVATFAETADGKATADIDPSVAGENEGNDTKTDKYITIEGTSVKVPLQGNKWVSLNGYWHFVKDGTLVKGWRNLTKSDGEKTTHYSYFDKTNGRLYTGWHKMGKAEGEKTEHWSYFGPNGWLRTGWHYMGTKSDPDGNNKVHWSYFGGNGWLVTGWKYLTKADGEKTAHFSYFGSNGWLRTGWQSMGRGTTNSFGENSSKHWSYFGNNGWLRTGMQTMATGANPDGKNKQHLSYFGGNGWLIENKVFSYSNEQYVADTRGWVTKDKTFAKAVQFINKVTNSSMSKREKLLKCYNYIQANSEFKSPWIPHYRGDDWPQKYADNYFDTMSGNCFSYASALGYIAKALGYENIYACNGKIHGWAEIDGLIYDTSRGYRGISYNQDAYYNYKQLLSGGESWRKVKIY